MPNETIIHIYRSYLPHVGFYAHWICKHKYYLRSCLFLLYVWGNCPCLYARKFVCVNAYVFYCVIFLV